MSAQSQTEPSGRDERKAPSGRKRRLVIVVGLIVLCAGAVAGAIYYWHSRFYESTDDAYIQGHPINVSARVSGNVMGVYVTDNQRVSQDTLLVEVDPSDYQIRVAKAQAAVQSSQADEIGRAHV